MSENGIENLYSKESDGIQCKLCYRHCRLSEGTVGVCGVNRNKNSRLESLIYGHADAIRIDPVEKKALYHFAPGTPVFSLGTVGCNYRCPFCQNGSLSFNYPDETGNIVSNDMIIQSTVDTGCDTIAFTYNEPTVSWLWFRDLAKMAHERGLRTVMVTNGSMSSEVCHEMVDLIDAVNIDLKCGDEDNYRQLLKGDRSSVFKNISELGRNGVWIELTTLLVPEISDSEDDLHKSAEEVRDILGYSVPWHISAYRPAYRYHSPSTPPELLLNRCDMLRSMGFYYVYPGNLTVLTQTHCPECGSALITRYGNHTETSLENGMCPKCKRPVEGRFF